MIKLLTYQSLFLHLCIGDIGSKVSIDSFYLKHIRYYKEENYTLKSLVQCTALCSEKSEWCLAYCYDKVTMLCVLTNLMVSPCHQDSVKNVTICHTFLKKDLVFSSTVTSSKVSSTFPQPSVLSKGIYNTNKLETCAGVLNNFPNIVYIMFELQKVYLIREIRVTPEGGSYEKDLPGGAEIKVGKTKPTIDGIFMNFEVFATIPSDIQNGKTYSFTSDVGHQGKYVTIIAADKKSTLTLCYVQIFE